MPGIREGTGGIQAFSRVYVRALVEAYPQHAFRVFVKNDEPAPDDPLRALGITFHSVHRLPTRLRTPALAALGIGMGLLERPVCTLATHLHFLPALLLLRKLCGIPMAAVIHGVEAWRLRSRSRIDALRQADHLTAVSKFTRQVVIDSYGLDPNRVSVVPNTFDLQTYQLGPRPGYLEERYGLKPGQPVILTVSRLALSERYKGHRQVLAALPWILEQFPEAHYLIVGDGDDVPALREAIAAHDLQHTVTLAGHVPCDELPDHYRLCDVFVMPSSREGFGIVFLEAMATGKPVIAGNADGSADALDDGRLGALVDPNDSRAIAQAVCQVLGGTYPNGLLFDPLTLRSAVVSQFGYPRVSALLSDDLAPLIDGSPRSDECFTPALSETDTPTRAPRVAVLTQLTSPYQVELFNAVAASGLCNLEVIYLTSRDRNREWSPPKIAHNHFVLSDSPRMRQNALQALVDADVTVFNYYLDRFAARAIRQRAATRRPWVFWGERPGFMQLGMLGRLMRRVVLAPLHASPVPIWGVGEFAIEGYRQEFGPSRPYVNMPYFSDLTRFRASLMPQAMRPFTFLYSGTLNKRKGVDLLAQAFLDVAKTCPHARLKIMGYGPLEQEMRCLLSPVQDRVEFTGFVDWHDLAEHYHAAHVLCVPSRHDGWALVVPEALAAGRPVIATERTGAAREFIRDLENGWLIHAASHEPLAEAMRKAAALTPKDWQAMSRAASTSVEEHTLGHGAQRFIDSIYQALEQAAPVCAASQAS
ncbi:MAG: glycosyltransferase family 4 protein [Roseimicrobium sp.]